MTSKYLILITIWNKIHFISRSSIDWLTVENKIEGVAWLREKECWNQLVMSPRQEVQCPGVYVPATFCSYTACHESPSVCTVEAKEGKGQRHSRKHFLFLSQVLLPLAASVFAMGAHLTTSFFGGQPAVWSRSWLLRVLLQRLWFLFLKLTSRSLLFLWEPKGAVISQRPVSENQDRECGGQGGWW
jgi:hypothetical protein